MPERNEQQPTQSTDQDLCKLFQTAGHHAPGSDLTARIMARVAVTPLFRPKAIRPLIGQRTWVVMAVALVGLLALTLIVGVTTPVEPHTALSIYTARFRGLLSSNGSWAMWMIGASVCALLLTILDRLLEKRWANVKG